VVKVKPQVVSPEAGKVYTLKVRKPGLRKTRAISSLLPGGRKPN
jgi:hypothetical protein